MALRRRIAWLAAPALVLAACGDDDAAGGDAAPSIIVTTNVLGDVVSEMVGDHADVTTVMPVGANPHDFQPSAQQVRAITTADALVLNGGGFEEGLLDAVDAARDDGVPTFEALSAVEPIDFAGHDDAEDGHDDGNADPHFFTDPARMVDAVEGIAGFIAEQVPDLDTEAFRTDVSNYVAELEALDAEVEAILQPVPPARRVLVTNHEVFGYFADRYGFEVVGTVVPGGSTSEGASAGDIAELAEIIESEGVSAIFAETSSPARLAETLAAEVGGQVVIVELFTESLGRADSEGATYLDMIRADAIRIADALTE